MHRLIYFLKLIIRFSLWAWDSNKQRVLKKANIRSVHSQRWNQVIIVFYKKIKIKILKFVFITFIFFYFELIHWYSLNQWQIIWDLIPYPYFLYKTWQCSVMQIIWFIILISREFNIIKLEMSTEFYTMA